jgi:hypothetical protein
MKNKIEDLRNHLFETLEALKDADKPMDLDRARTVAKVAQVIVESAKVEVALLNAVGTRPSTHFFPDREDAPPTTLPRRLAAVAKGSGR